MTTRQHDNEHTGQAEMIFEPWPSSISLPKGRRPIIYASRDEALCSRLLSQFLPWEPIEGDTYQRSITEKHKADFFLPEQNLVVEYHPAVVKWYGGPSVYNRLKRLERELKKKEFIEVSDILCAQISHEYFKRRRALMDMSPFPEVRLMRLIVATDFRELFQFVIKPYSNRSITYAEFERAINGTKLQS